MAHSDKSSEKEGVGKWAPLCCESLWRAIEKKQLGES